MSTIMLTYDDDEQEEFKHVNHHEFQSFGNQTFLYLSAMFYETYIPAHQIKRVHVTKGQ